jgi:glycosyltransferase involved in cell wall biosynthesis
MDNPFFSIIIPSYNRAVILPSTIQSVLEQTYNNWELIIVDDGSTDNTKEVVEKFVKNDNRIRYIYQENSERSAARNNGIRNSNGKWICFLDSDDTYKKNHLQTLFESIEFDSQNNQHFEFYFTSQETHYTINNTKKITKTNFDHNQANYFFASESIVPGRVCISKNVLDKLNFDEEIVIVEDSDLWFRISCYHKTKFIDEATFIYNIHEDNSINVKNNAYLTRLNGLQKTFSKPEKKFLTRKEIKTILNNCYFGIHKYYVARNEIIKSRVSLLKSIILYPNYRLKEKLYLIFYPTRIN